MKFTAQENGLRTREVFCLVLDYHHGCIGIMRQTDFDFARDLLTQAGLPPDELASTPEKGLLVTLEPKGPVAWIFTLEGEFLRFESDLRPVNE